MIIEKIAYTKRKLYCTPLIDGSFVYHYLFEKDPNLFGNERSLTSQLHPSQYLSLGYKVYRLDENLEEEPVM